MAIVVCHSKDAAPMSELGHLRRGHVDGMSAIAPIATIFLTLAFAAMGQKATSPSRWWCCR